MSELDRTAFGFALSEYERQRSMRTRSYEQELAASLRVYLEHAPRVARKGFALGPVATQMLMMQVGDIHLFRGYSPSFLRNGPGKTVKRHQPSWKFRYIWTNEGTIAKRVADNSPLWARETLNERYQLLANMAVGDSIIWPFKLKRRAIDTYIKAGAMRIMQSTSARWKCRNTTKGMKVIRVA